MGTRRPADRNYIVQANSPWAPGPRARGWPARAGCPGADAWRAGRGVHGRHRAAQAWSPRGPSTCAGGPASAGGRRNRARGGAAAEQPPAQGQGLQKVAHRPTALCKLRRVGLLRTSCSRAETKATSIVALCYKGAATMVYQAILPRCKRLPASPRWLSAPSGPWPPRAPPPRSRSACLQRRPASQVRLAALCPGHSRPRQEGQGGPGQPLLLAGGPEQRRYSDARSSRRARKGARQVPRGEDIARSAIATLPAPRACSVAAWLKAHVSQPFSMACAWQWPAVRRARSSRWARLRSRTRKRS